MQILPAEFCRSAQADIIDEVPKTTAIHPKPQWDPPPSHLQMPNASEALSEFGVEGLHCFGLAIHASHQKELKLAVAAGRLRAGVAASKPSLLPRRPGPSEPEMAACMHWLPSITGRRDHVDVPQSSFTSTPASCSDER